jgi:hypothetical protein
MKRFGAKKGYNAKNGLASFLGFRSVRPIFGSGGEERFGVVEIAPEYVPDIFVPEIRRKGKPAPPDESVALTAALRLTGPALNRCLEDERTEGTFFTNLCQNLPHDCPTTFILRRRVAQLGAHYTARQPHALNRFRDDEIAHSFLQEYLDDLIYPIEDFGVADLWFGVFVSGHNEEDLAQRMAMLVATLPCEAIPVNAVELSSLLLDYFAPAMEEATTERPTELYSEWLATAPLNVEADLTDTGYLNAYWTFSAPPLKHEAGWTRRLLENENLSGSEFTIALHLAPAMHETGMRDTLLRRRDNLQASFDRLEAQLDAPEIEMRELEAEIREVSRRLNALDSGQERYFESGITVALRAFADRFEDECGRFTEALHDCGLSAHRTGSVEQTYSALLDCAPLNLSRFDRPFVLPTLEAGRLAHLLVSSQPNLNQSAALAGVSRLAEPVYFNPAPKVGQAAFFLTGERDLPTANSANALTRYLAAMRWLSGGSVFGFDRSGEWAWLSQQVSGNYISLGPDEVRYNFNPLEVTGTMLSHFDQTEGWVEETTDFLTEILRLNDELREDLRAVLIEAAFARAQRNEDLNAAAIRIRAETSGYLELARALKEITLNGSYGWLFGRITRLPMPVRTGSLVFMSLAPEIRSGWSEKAQVYYWSRLFARWIGQISTTLAPAPFLLVVDNAHEFLPDPAAASTLGWLEQSAARLNMSVWLTAPRPDEWLNNFVVRSLFDKAQTHVFFHQTSGTLTTAAHRLGLSPRFSRAVRDTLAGGAVVRQIDEDGITGVFAFDPLPSEYPSRVAAAPPQFRAPATFSINIPADEAPVEVPLFATEELWNDDELENLQMPPVPPAAPVVVEGDTFEQPDDDDYYF